MDRPGTRGEERRERGRYRSGTREEKSRERERAEKREGSK